MLDAIGLDAASRGRKREEFRPDLLVVDDVDETEDTALTIAKKVRRLTRSVLPAGTDTMAVLAVQNLPNKDGIFAQLSTGQADFLLDRVVSGPFPALEEFACESVPQPDGPTRYHITQGTPTWEGLSVAACEGHLNRVGLSAFRVEYLHQTEALGGTMFQRHWFPIVDDWPREACVVRCWDLASTEATPGKDPDWTRGGKVAYHQGRYWIVDVQGVRGTPGTVEALIAQTAAMDGRDIEIWIEEEGGASGKTTIDYYQRTVLPGYTVKGLRHTSGKTQRAKPLSSAAEAGNVCMVRGPWNNEALDELVPFPSPGVHDDIVDCLTGAQQVLTQQPLPQRRAGTWGRR